MIPAVRLALTALAVAALAACSTTPLPPWPARTAPAPQPQRGVVVPPPLGAPRPGAVLAPLPPVVATPVPAAQPIAMPPPPQAGTLQDLPYSAAVAARFPEPNVRYNTPGLQENRRAFTSNGEIDQWLDRLAQAPSDNGTAARLLRLGPSQRGTSISALVLTRARDTDPETLLSSRRPTVLLIGQQHGDEPAGSVGDRPDLRAIDAGRCPDLPPLHQLRQLLAGPLPGRGHRRAGP